MSLVHEPKIVGGISQMSRHVQLTIDLEMNGIVRHLLHHSAQVELVDARLAVLELKNFIVRVQKFDANGFKVGIFTGKY